MPNVNDLVDVSFYGTQSNQRIIMTMSYRLSALPSPSQSYFQLSSAILDLILAAGTGSLAYKYLNCLTTDYHANFARVQFVAPIRQVSIDRDMTGRNGFQGTGNLTNIASAITLRTAIAGRNQTSTKHIGPIQAEDATNGLIAGDTLTALETLAGDLLTTLAPTGGGQLKPCIIHRHKLPTPTLYDDVVTSLVQPTVRTMRRRTVGRGI